MVLMGGFSAEREVSLQSGAGIAEALRRKGYEVTTHDLSDTRQLLAELGRSKPDVVFNALHGNWGEMCIRDRERQCQTAGIQIALLRIGNRCV